MIRFSLFENFYNNQSANVELCDFEDVIKFLAESRQRLPANDYGKHNLSYSISPAYYEEPNTTRNNKNVVGWGGLLLLDFDNDKEYISIEEAEQVIKALGWRYCIYTSPSCRPNHHKFRLVLEVDQWLPVEKTKLAWSAMVQFFNSNNDTTCKDVSRLYTAPQIWQATKNGTRPNSDVHLDFRFGDGDTVPIDEYIRMYPLLEEHTSNNVEPIEPKYQRRIERIREKEIKVSEKYLDETVNSPFMPKSGKNSVAGFQASPDHDKHFALYGVMNAVATKAAFYECRGFARLSSKQLAAIIKDLDNLCGNYYSQKEIQEWANKVMCENYPRYLLDAENNRLYGRI